MASATATTKAVMTRTGEATATDKLLVSRSFNALDPKKLPLVEALLHPSPSPGLNPGASPGPGANITSPRPGANRSSHNASPGTVASAITNRRNLSPSPSPSPRAGAGAGGGISGTGGGGGTGGVSGVQWESLYVSDITNNVFATGIHNNTTTPTIIPTTNTNQSKNKSAGQHKDKGQGLVSVKGQHRSSHSRSPPPK